jgi:hypothetical protein
VLLLFSEILSFNIVIIVHIEADIPFLSVIYNGPEMFIPPVMMLEGYTRIIFSVSLYKHKLSPEYLGYYQLDLIKTFSIFFTYTLKMCISNFHIMYYHSKNMKTFFAVITIQGKYGDFRSFFLLSFSIRVCDNLCKCRLSAIFFSDRNLFTYMYINSSQRNQLLFQKDEFFSFKEPFAHHANYPMFLTALMPS